jgi:hypothetical protein
MRARAQYAEYLAEVRERVCSQCPETAPDQPPFGLRCRRCGVELQLPQVVESIHDACEELDEFDPSPGRRVVCARCGCLDGGICPCPAGSLTALLIRAVKAVDERREQRDLLQRRLSLQPRPHRVPVGDMIRAYEAATGDCVCCD